MLSEIQTKCACSLKSSPNFGERKNGSKIDMILLHYTGMEDDDQALDWLCNEKSEVSSHYFIDRCGATQQLVAEGVSRMACGRGFLEG